MILDAPVTSLIRAADSMYTFRRLLLDGTELQHIKSSARDDLARTLPVIISEFGGPPA